MNVKQQKVYSREVEVNGKEPAWKIAFTVALSLAVAAPWTNAQTSAKEAVALVDSYIKTHNDHSADATLAYYAPDADFHLSMERGLVSGIEHIKRLEYFDAAVGSTLYPQNLSARLVAGRWHVGFDYVIEYSDVFSAMGLRIVLAEGLETGFILKDNAIQVLFQPDLYPACTAVMASGFRNLLQWLGSSGDPRAPVLLPTGSLNLTGETAPILVAAARGVGCRLKLTRGGCGQNLGLLWR